MKFVSNLYLKFVFLSQSEVIRKKFVSKVFCVHSVLDVKCDVGVIFGTII